jgi:chemotaxis signal transduction protein
MALPVELDSGVFSVPLRRLHHLAGYATLQGVAEDFFLGWLAMRGVAVPVFDLNKVVCAQPTLATFGTRILVLATEGLARTKYIGLLARGVTDTVDVRSLPPVDLDGTLAMLYNLIPEEKA